MKNKTRILMRGFLFAFCLSGLFMAYWVQPVMAAVAPVITAQSISEVCLLDGDSTSRRTVGMKNCLKEALVDGGAVSSTPNDTHYPNYPHFKASRWRISDFYDVQSMVSIPAAELQDNKGLYDFSALAYFRPSYFFTTSGPSRAIAAVRLNAGIVAKTPIDVFGMCRYLSNTSSNDVFVPFRTQQEWTAFLNNPPAGVTAKPCSLPCAGNCDYNYGPTTVDFDEDDSGGDIGSSGEYFATELPYAKEGTTWPSPEGKAAGLDQHRFNYKCYDRAVVPFCWQWGTCSSSSCTGSGATLSCTTTTYRCCIDWGTQCTDTEHSWFEVWQLNNFRAGASTDALPNDPARSRDKGWLYDSPMSIQIGGTTRPKACEEDKEHHYIQVGKECQPPPTSPHPKPGTSSPPPPPRSKCGW